MAAKRERLRASTSHSACRTNHASKARCLTSTQMSSEPVAAHVMYGRICREHERRHGLRLG
eukprot:scaffold17506_cov132-Isochrysis_galbana.AAC.11